MYDPDKLSLNPGEVIVYLRKSRSDEPNLTVEEVLKKHEELLNNWSSNHLGGVVPEENKFREIVSGETIEDRPKIKEVLKLIENPKIKAVLVVEVQRLSRGDLEDAGRIIKLLRYTNTLVITPAKTYDLQDEYDRDFFERELKRGNEFLEYQKRIMGRGRLLSVQQGNFIGSIAPYGYEKVIVKEGNRKCPTLKIKEEEADVVRMIFDLYVNQDMGRKSICRRLDDMLIPPPKGVYWSAAALKDLLENIHYIGKVKWNWRKTVTIVDDGEIVKTRPKARIGEFLIYDGKHPAIISEELFYAAQEKQGRNHRAKAKTKVRNPFAGLIFCKCGYSMSLRTYRNNGVERSASRLICDNQTHCGTSSCLYDEMLDRVCDILQQCIDDFSLLMQNDNKEAIKHHQALIKGLESQLSRLNKKEMSIWNKYVEEDMPRSIFDEMMKTLNKQRDEINEALCTAREESPDPIDYEEKLYRFRDALDALKDPDAPAGLKNRLLKACIDRIEYDRGKSVRVTRDMAPAGAKLPRGGRWLTPPFKIDVKLRF